MMTALQNQLILLFSIPIYGILIPLEILLSHFHNWKRYTLKETLTNIYLNIVNAGVDLLCRGFAIYFLALSFQYGLQMSFGNPWIYWLLLFLLEDFLFWLEHFVDHKVRLFWAVHVTHHSSEEYNLTTGFRSSVLMPLYRFIYFIPLAFIGFQPIDILFMYAITQIYGILVHTQSIKKMPKWIEAILVTPSHHRVHHASNVEYLDRNMGMVLIIWDRLFGTFTPEQAENKPVYGITHPIEKPYHPTHIIFHEWQDLWRDMQRAPSLKDKLKYLIYPPGWSHDNQTKTTKQLRKEKGLD